jgi:hypothetical protein|nr:MAG TPA: hypothetical protein [Crassvirales sp.]
MYEDDYEFTDSFNEVDELDYLDAEVNSDDMIAEAEGKGASTGEIITVIAIVLLFMLGICPAIV